MNEKKNDAINLNNMEVEEVQTFLYIGATMDNYIGATMDNYKTEFKE